MYEGKLNIVFPTELNKHYFSWFHIMEKVGFRQELRYSFEQLTKMLEKPELLLWFVTVDGKPQIILFGYSITDSNEKSFYLDTFAVKPRGAGIGNIVMEFLIRWAKTKKYNSIVLDTELRDEKGIPLQQFYVKHGFETVFSSEKGDLIMKRLL
jgi:GNAT superfamily N-acetyltransferase